MPDPTLFLFDGYNLLHAGGYDDARELVDRLASFVAQHGARGIVVFDGHGDDFDRGPLQVRYAPHADTLLDQMRVVPGVVGAFEDGAVVVEVLFGGASAEGVVGDGGAPCAAVLSRGEAIIDVGERSLEERPRPILEREATHAATPIEAVRFAHAVGISARERAS